MHLPMHWRIVFWEVQKKCFCASFSAYLDCLWVLKDGLFPASFVMLILSSPVRVYGNILFFGHSLQISSCKIGYKMQKLWVWCCVVLDLLCAFFFFFFSFFWYFLPSFLFLFEFKSLGKQEICANILEVLYGVEHQKKTIRGHCRKKQRQGHPNCSVDKFGGSQVK